eukprot:gene5312-7376_t
MTLVICLLVYVLAFSFTFINNHLLRIEAEMEHLDEANVNFPTKLYQLLDCEQHTGIIEWVHHGYSFRIIEPERFSVEIVPRYFKQTRLTSFQRQLNLYGFRRITKGEDQGSYFHPKFQRSRKDLIGEIRRLPRKGSLPTMQEFISTTHLPSERFGGIVKKTYEKNVFKTKKSEISPIQDKPIENQNPVKQSTVSVSSTVPTTASSLSIPTTSSKLTNGDTLYLPTMSKLTQNIGYAKFISEKKNIPQYSKTSPRILEPPQTIVSTQNPQSVPISAYNICDWDQMMKNSNFSSEVVKTNVSNVLPLWNQPINSQGFNDIFGETIFTQPSYTNSQNFVYQQGNNSPGSSSSNGFNFSLEDFQQICGDIDDI